MDEISNVVYTITCTPTGKRYIGSTRSFYKRRREHLHELRGNYHKNTHLQNAFNLYGKEAFYFEVIDDSVSINDLLAREAYWIGVYQSSDRRHGFNLAEVTTGRSFRHSEESKAKIGEASKGNTYNKGRHPSEETRRKLSLAGMGRAVSQETREKLRRANLGNKNCQGRKHTEETRRKMSNAQKGKTLSDETKLKIGLRSSNRSAETRRKLSMNNIGKHGEKLTWDIVRQIRQDFTGSGLTASKFSYKFFSNYLVDRSHIYRICTNQSWRENNE